MLARMTPRSLFVILVYVPQLLAQNISTLTDKLNDLEAVVTSALGRDKNCEICHVRYHHKDVADATDFGNDPEQWCKQYQDNSCCTLETANNIHNDQLYGDEYRWDRCGELSPACMKHFINEACFYECDVHVGKWRKHDDCMDGTEPNGWQIAGMPIKASECDQFFDDCRSDRFCVNGNDKSLFSVSTCAESECKSFSEIYANGKEMCELLWDNAFVYETNEEHAYTWGFEVGEPNPNNHIAASKAFPEACPDFSPSMDACHSVLTDLDDRVNFVQSQVVCAEKLRHLQI
mmetsp:Transcript_44479/g.83059  ORF Transcript_44479/g.83059 Transcript_44479/m.83059 type:complete len:290 (+) Transcript_44479:90-959(+)